MLKPELWALLLPIPFIVYFSMRTYAQASRSRRILMAAFRSLILVCVAASLVQIRVWRQADETRLCTLGAVDVSESIPESAAADIAKEIAACSAHADEDHPFGLLIFAGRSEVAIPPAAKPVTQDEALKILKNILSSRRGTPEYQRVQRQDTSFDTAMELAESTYPAGMGRRLVFWSDGNETTGAGVERAGSLARAGVDVFTRVIEARNETLDVLTASINVPTQIRVHEAFDARVQAMSTREISGKMLLYRNGFLVGQKDVKFNKGSTEIVFRQSLSESGQYLYRAVLDVGEAQNKDNDEAFAYASAQGPPRVLILGTSAADSARLSEALKTQRLIVEYRDAFGSPETLLDLFAFDAIVLNNIPAARFSENQIRLIRDYVRDFGGGLVVVGGKFSFGAGQYAGTALEDALPVSCATANLPELSTSVAVVVDSSRSLVNQRDLNGAVFDGAGFVRDATLALSKQLTSKSFFGIIGTGNEQASPAWPVRLQKIYDRERIEKDIQTAFAAPDKFGMSSNVYRSMRRAADELFQVDTMRKHLVVISDGHFEQGRDYIRLASQLGSSRVQISTIPVGPLTNTQALQDMARWGGGVCFANSDASSLNNDLKRLFDTSSQSAVLEETFRPHKLMDSPLIAGVDISLAPNLSGYVRTTLKLGASNILAVPPEYEPLLAYWPCGQGRVAAFTSDAKERWSVLWIREWGRHFDNFWGGVVRGVLKDPAQGRILPDVRLDGQTVEIRADMLGKSGELVSGQPMRCELFYLGEKGYVYSPSSAETVALKATAPGRYSGSFRAQRKGIYAVKLAGAVAGQIATTGLVVSNFREYLSLGPNKKMLKDLATVGGGESDGALEKLSSLDGKRREQMIDAGQWALLMGVILFGLDVVVRRWPAFQRMFARKS
jgi:Ca-activated chloride channel family protein